MGGRFALALALLVVALEASGTLGKVAICLTGIATLALIWSIVEVVACGWFLRLVAFRHLLWP